MLLGAGGSNTLDGGEGDDGEIQRVAANRAEQKAGRDWLAAHTRVDGDRAVLDFGSRAVVLPVAQLSQL